MRTGGDVQRERKAAGRGLTPVHLIWGVRLHAYACCTGWDSYRQRQSTGSVVVINCLLLEDQPG